MTYLIHIWHEFLKLSYSVTNSSSSNLTQKKSKENKSLAKTKSKTKICNQWSTLPANKIKNTTKLKNNLN